MKTLMRLGLAASVVLFSACAVAPGTDPTDPTPPGDTSTGPVETEPSGPASTAGQPQPAMVECEYPAAGQPARPVDPPESANVPANGEVVFTLATNQGDVAITMDRAKAPCTVNSFEALATQGFFDDTDCHRLVDSGIFVLQCGDPTGTGSGGPGYTFADETDPADTYPAGTVAMANAGPDTNGSQFFLVYQESPLPPDYTVFGTMDEESTGVVARIAVEGQDGSSPGGGGKPNNPAHINQVTVG